MSKTEIFTTQAWSPWDDALNKAIITAINEVVGEGIDESSEDIWDILLNLQYPYMDDEWQKELDDTIEKISPVRARIKAKARHFSKANKTHDWLVHVTHDGGKGDAIDKAWEQHKRRKREHG